MQTKLTKISVLTMLLLIAGGCADVAQIDAIKATANAALAEAKSASAQISSVRSATSDAAYAAEQAQADATAALQCCNDNSSRLDRAFQKAMKK